LNTEKGRVGESYAHGDKSDYNKIMTMSNPRPDLFTNGEWRDIQEHVFQDYYHHYETGALTPYQKYILNSKDRETLKCYQDKGLALFLYAPYTPIVLLDWIMSAVIYNRELRPLWLQFQYSKLESTTGRPVPGHNTVQQPAIRTVERSTGIETEYDPSGVIIPDDKKRR
jgi:hypothetical protein